MPACFIAMPVSTAPENMARYKDNDHFAHILEHLMVPAVERAGYEAIRPIAAGADLIHAEIIRQLETADLVLCDITTLNPNVFFELGIRTAVDRPVCIVKDSLTDRIPFDTSIINVHTYDPSLAPWLLEEQVSSLAAHLVASEQRSDGRNTLWRYFGLTTRAAFKESESSLEEKVDLLLLQLKGIESQSRSVGTHPANSGVAVGTADTNTFNIGSLNSDGEMEFLVQAYKIGTNVQQSLITFRPGIVGVVEPPGGFSREELFAIKQLARRYGLRLNLSKGHDPSDA